MSKQLLPVKFSECVEFTIPEFDTRPPIHLEWTKVREGENRLVEAQAVNGGTYAELEYTYNEGYREAKKNLSVIGYEIKQAKKIIRQTKSQYLLDDYPEFLKERKLNDNSANREAYLERQQDYVDAMDRLAMLEALESLLEGKVEVFVNVCRYMKKEIDILLRSGMQGNKYTSR